MERPSIVQAENAGRGDFAGWHSAGFWHPVRDVKSVRKVQACPQNEKSHPKVAVNYKER